jgi:predicted lysophospholipase L1 biosynthesis ABC-type transport system permease subunit
VQDADQRIQRQRRLIAFETRFLFGFAVAALAAAVVLVGQAVARQVATTLAQLRVLGGLGATPRQLMQLAAAGPLVAGCCGSVLGMLGAVLASTWFPIGAAAAFEPRPGLLPDPPVLAAGGLAVPGLVLACTVAAASLADWSRLRGGDATGRSAVVAVLVRSGAPVPAVVGARFALETRRNSRSNSARSALLGVSVGVLGVTAAFLFAAGIAEAGDNAQRFGQIWQVGGELGEEDHDYAPAAPILTAITKAPGVMAVADLRWGLAPVTGTRRETLDIFSYQPRGKPPDIVVTAGRMPSAPNEILLGPESATAFGIGLASRLRFAAAKPAVTMTVTGLGFVPETWRNSYASGSWVTAAGYDAILGAGRPGSFFGHAAFLQLRADARAQQVADSLNRTPEVAASEGKVHFEVAPAPMRLGELRQLRMLPMIFGGILAVLAVAAGGHALAVSVRRRAPELAVLRSLGLTTRQARGVFVTQATVLAGVGLAFGIPLGVALGRTLWRVVARSTPVQYVPPPALLTAALIVLLTLILANLLAAWPGHRAAQLRVADVLRAE